MLNKLEARFRLAGYKNIHFIIISPNSSNAETHENVINKMKFRKTYRAMNISDNLKNIASNVTVLTSDSDDDSFRDFNVGSAYVFDQCARLAYIIYYPWSSIQRPYVKASILSTIYDVPCGECNITYLQSPYPELSEVSSTKLKNILSDTQLKSLKSNFEINLNNETATSPTSNVTDLSNNITDIFYTTQTDDQSQPLNTSTSEETNNSEDQAYVIPIKVILHAEHVHQDPSDNETFLKFNYILLKTDDPTYHGHFITDEAERLSLVKNGSDTKTTSNDSLIDNVQEELISTNSISPNVLRNQNGDQYDQINEQIIVDEHSVVVDRFNEILWKRPNQKELNVQQNVDDNQEINGEKAMSSESDQENDKHYSQILQWIHFNL